MERSVSFREGDLFAPLFFPSTHMEAENSSQSRHLFDADLPTAMVCWRVGLLTRMILSFPLCSLLPSAVVVLEWGDWVPINSFSNRVFGALGIYIHFLMGTPSRRKEQFNKQCDVQPLCKKNNKLKRNSQSRFVLRKIQDRLPTIMFPGRTVSCPYVWPNYNISPT